jgi:hypothetical protein
VSSSIWSECEVFGLWWMRIWSCKKICSGGSGLDIITWSFELQRGIGKNWYGSTGAVFAGSGYTRELWCGLDMIDLSSGTREVLGTLI